MIRRLVEAFGADYVQWRALARVGLKLFTRKPDPVTSGRKRSSRSSMLWLHLFLYIALGVAFSGIVYSATDVLLAATLIVTYTMLMTAVAVLVDYHSVVTSPDDYSVLGFQPISSRTYFAARLTSLLAYVLMISTAFGVAPAITTALRDDNHIGRGVALMVAVYASSVTVALAMVLLYGWMLRYVPARRLTATLSYLQLAMSFVVYGGYIVLPRLIASAGIGDMRLARNAATLWYPGTWFGSYVEIADGHFGATALVPAFLSLVLFLIVARSAAGGISLEFSDRLASLSTAQGTRTSQPTPAARGWSVFREGEARAVWLLIRAQFRSDQKFRMAVLAILPMTVVYLFLAIEEGAIANPFLASDRGLTNGILLYMAIILFPTMLMSTLTTSEHFKAAWIFFATPADRQATVLAMKNTVFISFVVPYLGAMAILFAYYFRNPVHVAVHVAVLGLLSHLTLLLIVVFDPHLPFSRPQMPGERTAQVILVTILTTIIAAVAVPVTVLFIYVSPLRTALFIAAMILTTHLLERLGRQRMRRNILEAEFMG